MALGYAAWKEARARLQELLSVNCNELKGNGDLMSRFVFCCFKKTVILVFWSCNYYSYLFLSKQIRFILQDLPSSRNMCYCYQKLHEYLVYSYDYQCF